MSGTVVDVVTEMRAVGAALKAESYEDDDHVIVAVVYADGREAAEELLEAFRILEERRR